MFRITTTIPIVIRLHGVLLLMAWQHLPSWFCKLSCLLQKLHWTTLSPHCVDSLIVIVVDTSLDWTEPPSIHWDSVRMLVKLSPGTDQRQLAHYLCTAERPVIHEKSAHRAATLLF